MPQTGDMIVRSHDLDTQTLARLLLAIRAARPAMTLRARAIVEAILLSHGSIGSAESVARTLGFANRFRLARFLHGEGLPPLHRLTEWVTVFSWTVSAELHNVSLCWIAFRSHRHPSACYRLVKKVTGCGWEEVHANGSGWVLRVFLQELRNGARWTPTGTRFALASPPSYPRTQRATRPLKMS